MKLLSLLTCSMVTLVGLIGMATAAPPDSQPQCQRTGDYFTKHYNIFIAPLPKKEIGPLCDTFWKKLKRHWLCTVSSPHGCGPWTNSTRGANGTEGVKWEFTVFKGCNSGMVESAFWEATKNRHGGIDCY